MTYILLFSLFPIRFVLSKELLFGSVDMIIVAYEMTSVDRTYMMFLLLFDNNHHIPYSIIDDVMTKVFKRKTLFRGLVH